jgi:putative flippase GtrA
MTQQKSSSLTSSNPISQMIRFGIIGVLAALTHYAIAVILTHEVVAAAWSNLIAFIIAFWVSYFGHRYFSFNASNVSHQQTLPRFIFVALLGFMLNQTLLLFMLHFTTVAIAVGLPFILILTAIFTFILSRQFAFNTSNRSK